MNIPNYAAFLGVVIGAGIRIEYPKEQRDSLYHKERRKPQNPIDAYLSVQWRSGGMHGGSCWGSKADQPITADPEPDFEELDKLLEKIEPNISFLQYKAIYRECVETGDGETDQEYYGNYTTYLQKTCKLEPLYNYLLEKGIISNV